MPDLLGVFGHKYGLFLLFVHIYKRPYLFNSADKRGVRNF